MRGGMNEIDSLFALDFVRVSFGQLGLVIVLVVAAVVGSKDVRQQRGEFSRPNSRARSRCN